MSAPRLAGRRIVGPDDVARVLADVTTVAGRRANAATPAAALVQSAEDAALTARDANRRIRTWPVLRARHARRFQTR